MFLSDLSDDALSAARRAMARVKARRSAESAVFLRDMLEYKIEYDDISPSKASPASSKILPPRIDSSLLSTAHDSSAYADAAQGADGRGDAMASSPKGLARVVSGSPLVAPRKYLFETPTGSSAAVRWRAASACAGEDAEVDYIRQLAAEEFAGLSCYALLGVARQLDCGQGGGNAGGKGQQEGDLAFALEQARSECVLWKAKEEMARSAVVRVLTEYRHVSAQQKHTLEVVCVCVCVCVCLKVSVCVCVFSTERHARLLRQRGALVSFAAASGGGVFFLTTHEGDMTSRAHGGGHDLTRGAL
jgi:hypothetical protein